MLNQTLIYMLVIVFTVLGLLLFGLMRWNKKLKIALNTQLANHNATSLQPLKLEAASKNTTKPYVVTFVVIAIVIFGTAISAYEYYEADEDLFTSAAEAILIVAGLIGGFLLGGLWRRFEALHFLTQLLGQINQREWVERKLSSTESRLIKQQQVLATLSQNPYGEQSLSDIVKEYTQIAAETLNVERVSIWLIDAGHTELECVDFYTKSTNSHLALPPVLVSEIPQYFQQLTLHRVIAAHDALHHPIFAELTDGYLQDNNIGAILDGGIWLDGKAVGVVCIEHVGGVRDWTADEQSFAGAIADLARVTIETCNRRIAEQALLERSVQLEQMVQARTQSLQESDQRFSYVLQNAPVAILCLNGARELIEMNPEAEKISGYSRAYAIGKTYDELFSSEETRAYNQALIKKMDQYGNFQGERTLVRRSDGSTVELLVSHSIGFDADGNPMAIAIAQDMSIHNALEASLIKAREAAEASDRTKSMFVAAMSHELRTPLNSIIGFLGVVLQGLSGDLNPVQKGQLDRAYQSSKHLLLLISDVLDISKIEAGYLQINPDKFELKPLLGELEHAVQHLMAGKKLTLSMDCAAKLQLNTDRKRLYQVLLNVLGNAVKYTEQGSVKMSARLDKKQLKIDCTDTGIGIAQADFHKLFQPFERVDSPLKIKTSGTGLGLYLSHKIVTQLLGGSIEVRSKLGQGTTFTIIMPVNTPLAMVQKTTTTIEAKAAEPVS
jgi:PAS domain S-box-containing protein